jgi:hypothetical protein
MASVCAIFSNGRVQAASLADGALVRDCRLVYRLHLSMLVSPNNLFLGNAFVTMTFGVGAFLAPTTVVQLFVLDRVNEVTKSFIRGYAAATMGYGYLMLSLGKSEKPSSAAQCSTMLQASAIFNIMEVMLQTHAALTNDRFNNMIWVTNTMHLLLGAWSVWLLWTGGTGIKSN